MALRQAQLPCLITRDFEEAVASTVAFDEPRFGATGPVEVGVVCDMAEHAAVDVFSSMSGCSSQRGRMAKMALTAPAIYSAENACSA